MHDGTLRPKSREDARASRSLQRCTSAPGLLQGEQYLPPWIEKSKYELALSKKPPSWSAGAFAARGHSATPGAPNELGTVWAGGVKGRLERLVGQHEGGFPAVSVGG
ncbi:unnamed protein product [Durusdinium trenchii]|uniref:Uncharacterized protein n=1 Tax=Durusdinium trenchii TaxID=1381693 RepID=A0ABP0JAP1_9DINO